MASIVPWFTNGPKVDTDMLPPSATMVPSLTRVFGHESSKIHPFWLPRMARMVMSGPIVELPKLRLLPTVFANTTWPVPERLLR